MSLIIFFNIMRYPLFNLIISSVVGVGFLAPIISVVENERRTNVVQAGGVGDEVFANVGERSFQNDLKSQYFSELRLPVNRDVLTPKKVGNYEEYGLNALSGVVMDIKTKDVLFGKNLDAVSSIASITKLMTALVFLELKPDFEKKYTIKSEDRRDGGRIYLYSGDEVSIRDLFNLSLVASANTATVAMISSLGFSEGEFVEKMNAKALELGLRNTSYGDATGLSEENVSTVRDLARLATIAFKNPDIRGVVKKKSYSFTTQFGIRRFASTTNSLLESLDSREFRLLGGKTGYNALAKYCFVSLFRDRFENEVVSVVLGAEGKMDRFLETEKMVEWVYDSYQWN